MTTPAFQALLDADIEGAILMKFAELPMGEWMYAIFTGSLIFAAYIKNEKLETPILLIIISASPLIALSPTISLHLAMVLLPFLVITIAIILYHFARGKR